MSAREWAPAGAAITVGAVLAAAALSDRYLWFVRPTYQLPLLATAAVLVVCGIIVVATGIAGRGHTEAREDHPCSCTDLEHGDGHQARADDSGAGHGLTVWLALAGAALIAVCATGPVTGALSSGKPLFAGGERTPVFKALPDGVPTVPLHQIGGRLRVGQTLDGRTISVTGQLVDEDGGLRIARMQLTCCASDAVRSSIRITGTGQLAPGTWITATVTAARGPDGPQLTVIESAVIDPPRNPYES
ncbi:TIGR03943 family protein OS=Tsukamurella paurometabola (strain ATCC 8368 / DSM / CCUG 35730/ CIP 100753 / JCM 10117 / KCTC 9821 / NBRC 16120 / NCIMB 702349/ NCTC 13040) OX=521096 GN=Tpau_4252 PE=4 SV=1 [Tsukamurella paurometabola]|uniref:TIGR03943 family protein n=1 Tax=Tsukamurella paurometabola (strain ATCC 8368 / DSM 20162 / CCUG 35730 / CIP 100753 / JCM 10117 / KCTC 9821 / NBRC 16120 / NCIMB 702349 / NCTC 13040) TaxID=521096 RepID=D5UYX3_TSUPD|nr:hypothetical protein [Tsukamurella paurometabola]ADG80820.1 conserved hypothetical protein [Tsukamurella paurometabola DSM 20162]SUQ39270.1 Uncharacterised protein [Tsukamurella paurometabola]